MHLPTGLQPPPPALSSGVPEPGLLREPPGLARDCGPGLSFHPELCRWRTSRKGCPQCRGSLLAGAQVQPWSQNTHDAEDSRVSGTMTWAHLGGRTHSCWLPCDSGQSAASHQAHVLGGGPVTSAAMGECGQARGGCREGAVLRLGTQEAPTSPFPLAPLAHNPQPMALLPLAREAPPSWHGGCDEDANPQPPLLSVGLGTL